MPQLESELDALYAAPLDEFTARRNRLAGRLRAAGQHEQASDVARLKKPPLPVWTVNQLARAEPEALAKLVHAAEQLAKTQTSRSGSESLQEAAERHRAAVRNLVDRADHVAGRSLSDDMHQRISSTLRSASLDPSTREALARGRLSEEAGATGFNLLSGLAPATRGSAPRPTAASQSRAAEVENLRERIRLARAEVNRLRSDAAAAAKEARRARRAADKAEAGATAVQSELERAERLLADLDSELRDARRSTRTHAR